MIEFRDHIPDIFVNYFKLNPLQRSRSADILRVPLADFGMRIEDAAMQQILDDLTHVYSLNQRERHADVGMAPSPPHDPFLELPALQIVANQLWETRTLHQQPFSLTHYQSLGHTNAATPAPQPASEPETSSPEDNMSPAQTVLDHYLTDRINNVASSEAPQPEVLPDLRTDCLYLLTDESRHRRALTESALMENLPRIRPSELDLPTVDADLLTAAMQPLVANGLVRDYTTIDGQREYELAHDFAARSVVRNWRQLDRRRTQALALRSQERELQEEQFSTLLSREHQALSLLRILPAISALALVALIGRSATLCLSRRPQRRGCQLH